MSSTSSPRHNTIPDFATLTQARDIALEAAGRAASFIQAQCGRPEAQDIQDKGLNDFATFVDEGAQQLIIASIRSAFSDHAILAEEGFEDSSRSLADIDGWLWIIDPLDGTTNFLHGIPHYGVSIGLQHNGTTVLGVVRDVCRGETFHAIRGAGAFQDGLPCHVSKAARLSDSLITTGFPYKQFDYLDGYTDCIRRFWQDSRGVRRPGSASLDLAWVACGRFEGFFEQGLMPWDVSAGALILEEAGGRYTDFYGRSPGPDSSTLGSEIVASNALIHDEMIARLGPLRHPDAV
ncbi:MAG: inositol monophosphatase family protein [Bacteroidetes bacterium]|nr:inositol monophosphatase family protein [Bacteroidota bacterium]